MKTTNSKQIKFSEKSFDPFGRVFFLGDRVFRAISIEYKDFCEKLLESPLIKELYDKNLIPKTTISDIRVDGYALVLEHENITYTQPSEWCFSMLKDAGITILDVNEICLKHGYCLKDGHPWNVSFRNNNAVFLDFGSIAYRDSEKERYFSQEFIDTVCYPLILWSKNEELIAQALLSSPLNIYKRTIPTANLSQSNLIESAVGSLGIKVEASKSFINKLPIPDYIDTMWGKYQDEFFDGIKSKFCHRFKRFKRIKSLIQKYSSDATTILDLAGNIGGMGYYLEKSGRKYKKIINIDYDENAIEASYKKFKNLDSKVETYLSNFILQNQINHNIANRFKSDVVLALALTHHLVLSQNYKLDLCFDIFKSFSKKYVYIEFMPLGLWGGGELPQIPQWYSEDWFQENFVKKFDLVYKERLEKNRVIFIGKVKHGIK